MNDSISLRIAAYENTATHNDALYREFTELTDSIEWLKYHRDAIEMHKWGFGDRAFHYMWYLLLQDLVAKSASVKCLEIGVFKGQAISLWSKVAQQMGMELDIAAISPLEGKGSNSKLLNKLRTIFDRRYRQLLAEGNLYPEDDYWQAIGQVFQHFGLEFTKISFYKGYSSDPSILQQIGSQRFHLVYIDGDHSLAGCTADITNYAPLIGDGGYLVMDDASYSLPGESFWKGIEVVSQACEIIPDLGFKNVLNIGHNRIFRKIQG